MLYVVPFANNGGVLLCDASDGDSEPNRQGDEQEMFVASSPAVLPLFERFEPIVVTARVQGYSGHPWSLTRVNAVTKTDAN